MDSGVTNIVKLGGRPGGEGGEREKGGGVKVRPSSLMVGHSFLIIPTSYRVLSRPLLYREHIIVFCRIKKIILTAA